MSLRDIHDQPPAAADADRAWFWLLLLGLLAGCYLLGVVSPRHKQPWPWHRTLSWTAGLVTAAAALIGPIARNAAGDFRCHMLAHLLLGMLAPLLLVLGAPVTLLLRSLPTTTAKRVTRLLGSPPLRIITHPVTALALNTGGLWFLYTTDLHTTLHGSGSAPLLISVHMLAAGYLFTAAIIGLDPVRHRAPWMTRALVLIAAMAGHAILAKWLYAHPPAGIPIEQVERGARLMYYGGDVVDLLLVIIFCARWYHATRPRPSRPSKVIGPEAAGSHPDLIPQPSP
jgi:putative membrane protein